MFGRRSGSKTPRPGDLTAFVDEGSEIEGRYSFRGTAMLNGRFTGEITTTDTLIVGDKGVVKATIRAGTVIVNGEVTGEITATRRLELRATARVTGEIDTPALIIDDGARFEGRCRMTPAKPEPVAPARDLTVVRGTGGPEMAPRPPIAR
ncbi:MAG: polymer-forming cytoskeletal protein [Candidatus Rokubacteria bacterium]|nr:polymer-forming cytoskeletal protein [Candidatus Rokubacteria bacterium]